MDNTQVDFKKDDYRYMKQAITQAKKAYKLNEVPIGCVIVYDGKEEATTAVTLIRLLSVMPRLLQLRKPAATWATGVLRTALYMLRLNLARCVQVLLFRQEFQELLSAQ